MKNFLTCILALSMVVAVKAQQGFHTINAGADVALPLGNFSNAYGIGFGATGKAYYGITEKGDITGTVGYLRFGIKESNEYMSGHMGIIPITVGYRHDFGGLYAEPQLGLYMVNSKVKMDFGDLGDLFGDLSGSANASQTKAGLALGGGYVFGDWDLGARFQLIDNLNFLGIRIGYNFAL